MIDNHPRNHEDLVKGLTRRVTLLERWMARLVNVSLPVGTLLEYGGPTAPSGFVMADGASYLRTDLPALFEVYGTTYGAVDGTHFNVPNRKGRAGVGLDPAQVEFETLGETGGVKKPPNMVTKALISASYLRYRLGGTVAAWTPEIQAGLAAGAGSGSFTTGFDTEAVGAADNLSPYIVLNYIIKT